MRALAIDFGTVRVGWALGDPTWEWISDKAWWPNDDALINTIKRFILDHQITVIVVGRPISLESRETAMTLEVDRFMNVLSKELPSITITPWEERLTSHEAHQVLSNSGKKKERGDVDATAAAIILENFLAERKRIKRV